MSYNFKPLDWTHSTNIYEVNIRQYTREGTLKAFSRELPRLREMGVRTLWLMPVTPIAQKNKKGTLGSYYAASDYTSINAEFGTLDDFRILVKQAHDLGFKLIIDWVANHTGWDHKWTIAHPDFYKKDEATGDFKRAAGMDDIIELDFHNPDMVRAMIDAMKFWVTECNIDGFRCDLAFWVELNFWQKARSELDSVKPLFWLGELDPLEHPEYMGTFDAAYTWRWMHKAEEFYSTQLARSELETILNEYDAIGNASMRVWFTSNHDENSWNGTEYEKYGDMAMALAVFSCTWNGIPLIYSGQELPNMKRLKFFEKDEIAWPHGKNGKIVLQDFYKSLLGLHSTHPALRAGDEASVTLRLKTNADSVFAFARKNGEDEVIVLLNFSSSDIEFAIDNISGDHKEIFSGAQKNFSADPGLQMKKWGYLVFQKIS